jgi:dihydrodipicolinate synthase/N-acetylneuraminate lyase
MKPDKKFKGTIVPAITPLTTGYQLDEEAVERMFAHLQDNDAMPFILGTTGESASLPAEVKNAYLAKAVKLKAPGAQLYVGVSSNTIKETINLANQSFDAGADAVAATLPSYYTLSEDQMKRYFMQLADEVTGPLIIYNIPATTHMSIPLELIEELSYHENIVGTKDSERSQSRLSDSLKLWANRPDFSHFLGWAAQSAYALLNGSDGLIPSTGNLAPEVYCEMNKAVLRGDTEAAYFYQHQSDELGNLYQSGRLLGESLRALKLLMNEVGLCQPVVMPPLHALPQQEEITLIRSFHELMAKENITLNKYNHV